ncbi:mRNA surveillance protein pelota [Methanothermobacter thermautotrophicus]|uniref:mRNA surveillance protein pelota n=1 Tax=Methanothermobacter thermautotrophicus TaxID=145262 RepID=UPI003D7F61C6
MRIVEEDEKNGVIELVPETLDDLWHLSHIIDEGDLISARTTRRIQDTSGEKIRSDRGVKKTFYLGIRVENVSFHIYTGRLRATGVIERGPEDLVPMGSHHTLEVKLNTPLRIQKEHWSRWTLKRLRMAVRASKNLKAIILVIEDDVADLGLIRQYGVEYRGPITGHIPGKRIQQRDRGKLRREFYESIVESLQKYGDLETIIIAGPGFYKSDFYDYLMERYPEIAKKAVLENTGTGGRAGISEVLRKGTVERVSSEKRIASEIRNVNEFLEKLARDPDSVVYGKGEVMDAINMGAVEKLLVLDRVVSREDIEGYLDMVEGMGGSVVLISSEHEGGKQLESLGGLAGILRFKIQ